MKRVTAGLIAGAALAAQLGLGLAKASADDGPVDVEGWVMTVDGVDYPVCAEEDCSDQPGQVGLWWSNSTQRWLLELGEGVTFVVRP